MNRILTRREYLMRATNGFAGLALADLMATDAFAASPLARQRASTKLRSERQNCEAFLSRPQMDRGAVVGEVERVHRHLP